MINQRYSMGQVIIYTRNDPADWHMKYSIEVTDLLRQINLPSWV